MTMGETSSSIGHNISIIIICSLRPLLEKENLHIIIYMTELIPKVQL